MIIIKNDTIKQIKIKQYDIPIHSNWTNCNIYCLRLISAIHQERCEKT